jgi:hypothetical protein
LFIITRFNCLAVDFEYKFKQKEEKHPRFLELFLGLFELFNFSFFVRQKNEQKWFPISGCGFVKCDFFTLYED